MFDEKGIVDHLRELDESLSDWERYQFISLDELHTDRDKRNMVLHALLVSIQAAIDIANHLIAERKLRKPTTYRESFEILREESLLPNDLAEKLVELAGFRNVLVHVYWRLDIDVVHTIVQRNLDSLRSFVHTIKNLL